jgi:small subunit ribosomal protein S17
MSETTETSRTRAQPRKVREGLVVSDKMDKTVVVVVEDRVKHALYGKVLRKTSQLKAHDEQNQCGIGDRVLIMETRPLSATKRWRVVEVLEKAKYPRLPASSSTSTTVRQARRTARTGSTTGDNR